MRPFRRGGLGVPSLSVGKDADLLGFLRSGDETAKGTFSVPVRERDTIEPPKLSGGLCGLLEYTDDATSGRLVTSSGNTFPHLVGTLELAKPELEVCRL